MNIYLYSIIKSVFKQSNRFSILSNLSIIISTSLCLLSVIISLNISEGFKSNIIQKITEIDGDYHIFPYDKYNAGNLIEQLNANDDITVYPLIQKKSIFRYNSKSEGVNMISFFHKNELKKYVIKEFIQEEGVYIGSHLARSLNIVSDTEIVAIFFDNDMNRYLRKIKVKGIFETKIPDYDNHVVYSDYSKVNNLEIFNIDDFDEYIIYNNNSDINSIISIDDFYIEKWNDRNYDFFKWLNSYDIPIKILLVFFMLVLFFNNFSMFYLDYVNRREDFLYLNVIGLRIDKIFTIIKFKFLFLTLIGVIIALSISFIFSYSQSNYGIVSIAPNIYFSDFLPIENSFKNYFYPSLFTLLFSFIIVVIFFYKKDTIK